MFLCKLQTECDSAGIWVLEKHSPHQSVLIFSCFSVCISYLVLLQVYQSIFTSPSLAKDILDEEDDAENMPPTKSRKTSSNNKFVRRSVASKLHLNGKVTPRSVAYAAVQVCLRIVCRSTLIHGSSSISICRLRNHGLQFMMDLITKGYITMLLMSLRRPLGLLRRNVPKIYSTGGQSKCFYSCKEYQIKQRP